MEGSNFYAYKVTLEGAVSYFEYDEVRYSNMIFIDNGIGVTPMVGKKADALTARMSNVKIYGESPARDCFYQNECRNREGPGCIDRMGLMVSYFSESGKEPLITKRSKFPVHKVKSDASWGGLSIYDNVEFIGFTSGNTFCGVRQRAI